MTLLKWMFSSMFGEHMVPVWSYASGSKDVTPYAGEQCGVRYTRSVEHKTIPLPDITFPETSYPMTILDAKPYYFATEAQDSILSPFEKDVQESFKRLETKTKVQSNVIFTGTSKLEKVNISETCDYVINNISQTQDSINNTSATLDESFSETDFNDTISILDSIETDFINELQMDDIDSNESELVEMSSEDSKSWIIDERSEDIFNNLIKTNTDNEYNFTTDYEETTILPML
ncbi:unnamed protein product [Pieris macdunnoughi]|uniref:Uncharacterized protein n=1 Tax=Pieris macdunnoughi TaxID=345717 RepID=A0A821VZA2_9NEOP|nr:unnamed protein product [Pieris macdunnoughi]